ncbi:MAG: hypothetical protein LR015_06805 [Verrucomicrobia bacterium]|nr:hypothetical protein [Verrucomicrobiota bacterium]
MTTPPPVFLRTLLWLLVLIPTVTLSGQQPYEIISSSWLGGASGDQVRGTRIGPDGRIHMVAQLTADLTWAGTPTLLAGGNASSGGVYLQLNATGQQVLAYAKVADEVFHLDTDASGHPYIATNSGVIKLDPDTLAVLWIARADLDFRDLDVGPAGMVAARRSTHTHVFDNDGSNERIIQNYRSTFDVAIDETREVVYQIGWRQANSGCNPVQIAYLRAVDFNATFSG